MTRPFWILVESNRTTSTNADLIAAARAGAPEGTVHTTRHQTAGRGRLGRSFQMAPEAGLAVSALVRPQRPLSDWPWIGLLAGLAVRDTLAGLGVGADLKWPNDVLVDGRKIAGILVELVDDAAVVGIGLNTAMTAEQLPVPTATSLALEGADTTDRRVVLGALLDNLERRYRDWNGGLDVGADYRSACSTLGQHVRVARPGGDLEGIAEDVDEAGRLVVDGVAVSVGDVTHVRSASAPA